MLFVLTTKEANIVDIRRLQHMTTEDGCTVYLASYSSLVHATLTDDNILIV